MGKHLEVDVGGRVKMSI